MTAKEQHDVGILGFKTVTLEVGGGGNSLYLVGGALSQGVACSKPGGGADAGLVWTERTGQIIGTTTDAGRFITFQQTKHGKELGERCKVGADCKGYNLPVGSHIAGVACCNRVCTKTKKDYAGSVGARRTAKLGCLRGLAPAAEVLVCSPLATT